MSKYLAITIWIVLQSFCLRMDAQQGKGLDNLSYVDPTIGNIAQLLQPTRPTFHLPNQMMRVYPYRTDFSDDRVAGFPLIMVSHRLGEAFCIRPFDGRPSIDSWKEKFTYDHNLEINKPWYYFTYLVDKDISVEFTPGKKVGIYRFEFPSGRAQVQSILLNSCNAGTSSFNFISATEITGMETYQGNIKVYLYGRFSKPGKPGVVIGGIATDRSDITGTNSRAYITFAGEDNGKVEFRYAISYVSPDQAKRNFEKEFSGETFEKLRDQAESVWKKTLGQIQVEGGTGAQKRSFYTALYRCYERMVDITEDGKYFSGFDGKVHSTERPFYVDDWTWDTYLAHHPLRTILNPSQEEDILNSYVLMYQQSGWMPTFPVLFGDHACMNGFHSSIMFLDAYRKGLRGFNVEKAYEGMYKNSTQATMLPWRNGPKTSLDDFYYSNGYFPALKPGEAETNSKVHSFEKRQAVAVTLGASYDDWAVGQMAKELGKQSDYQGFSQRALNYKNLWNAGKGMFLPKDARGEWINIDPAFDGGMGGREYYDENNGWTYLWQVQHDVPGLINLMGGKDSFERKLDQLFREPLHRSKYEMWSKFPDATGLVGQFSMGNEPSFHIPYLYNFTSSPWKTQKRIRFLLDLWFKDNVFGIPGDEDGGGMSAFVVFSSLGFYPVVAGLPVYTIGSPLFEKSTIDLPGGKKFTVIAEGCSEKNKYIQSATLNDRVLNVPWFTHEELTNGGILKLQMGPKPNKTWGTDSYSVKVNP